MIARVTVRSGSRALPYRHPERGIVCWPRGRWTVALAGPELRHAVEEGAIERVHELAVYDMAPALGAVAEHYLALRKALASDVDLAPWAKMLSNSLVGKLGARDRRWVRAWSDYPGPRWCTWWALDPIRGWERWRRLADDDERQITTGFAADAAPAMGGWITSAGRMQLYRLVRAAGWDQAVYLDTDAILATERGTAALDAGGWVAPGQPGALRRKEQYAAVHLSGLRNFRPLDGPEQEEHSQAVPSVVPLVPSVEVGATVRAALAAGVAPRAQRHQIARAGVPVYRHGVRNADGTVSPLEVWEAPRGL